MDPTLRRVQWRLSRGLSLGEDLGQGITDAPHLAFEFGDVAFPLMDERKCQRAASIHNIVRGV
jgi:hypothetical protein